MSAARIGYLLSVCPRVGPQRVAADRRSAVAEAERILGPGHPALTGRMSRASISEFLDGRTDALFTYGSFASVSINPVELP